METVELGQKVRDRITGFEGVAVAKTEWLNGCWRISIQSKELKDGAPIDPQVFDIEQLELVEDTPAPPAKRSGGDRPNVATWR